MLEIINDKLKLNDYTEPSDLEGSRSSEDDREETANGSGSVSDSRGESRISDDRRDEGDVQSDGDSRNRSARTEGVSEPEPVTVGVEKAIRTEM